jgi:hypothetical protein
MPNAPLGEVEGATTHEPKGMTCPMTPKQIDISQLPSGKLT